MILENQIEFKDFLSIIIPSVVTIVGFSVTASLNKRNHYQNIQQLKIEKQLSDLYCILEDVFEFLDMLLPFLAHQEDIIDDFKKLEQKIHSTVFSAGSKDAVNILVHLKEIVYSGIDDHINVPNAYIVACYVLLAVQVKYDVTGVELSPLTWYKGKFTTQKMIETSDFYNESIITINEIVDKLKLRSSFRIDAH